MQRIRLGAGALRVEVAPQVGGSIARFDLVDPATGVREALLRGCDEDGDDDAADVLAAGCFPLVPFANRIRGGRFECDGRSVMLAPNMAGDPSPLHGQGWRAAWQPLGASRAGLHRTGLRACGRRMAVGLRGAPVDRDSTRPG